MKDLPCKKHICTCLGFDLLKKIITEERAALERYLRGVKINVIALRQIKPFAHDVTLGI